MSSLGTVLAIWRSPLQSLNIVFYLPPNADFAATESMNESNALDVPMAVPVRDIMHRGRKTDEDRLLRLRASEPCALSRVSILHAQVLAPS